MNARFDLTLPCYCSAAAKNRSACAELLSGPGFPTERVARNDLTMPCYCFAGVKNRSECFELLSGPGLPTERVARSDLTLPCYCSATAKSRSACTELLFGPRYSTERVHTKLDPKLPRYSSAAANFVLPALNLSLALGFQPNGCMPDLGSNCPAIVLHLRYLVFCHGTARSAAGFPNPKLFCISVSSVSCDVSDPLTSVDSVVVASKRMGACPI